MFHIKISSKFFSLMQLHFQIPCSWIKMYIHALKYFYWVYLNVTFESGRGVALLSCSFSNKRRWTKHTSWVSFCPAGGDGMQLLILKQFKTTFPTNLRYMLCWRRLCSIRFVSPLFVSVYLPVEKNGRERGWVLLGQLFTVCYRRRSFQCI